MHENGGFSCVLFLLISFHSHIIYVIVTNSLKKKDVRRKSVKKLILPIIIDLN